MKKLLLYIFVVGWTVTATAQKITVSPSETTELISVIMHLSGANEYNNPKILPEYKTFIDQSFGKWREHPAVKQAKKLHDKHGLVWSTPMNLAVSGGIEEGEFHTPYSTGFRWSAKEHEKFINAINDFYRETGFNGIYIKNMIGQAYPHIQKLMAEAYNKIIDLTWLAEFTGENRDLDYCVTISLLNGDYNYGCSVNGIPRPVVAINNHINPEDIRYPMVLLHEFLHPYINPMVDRHYAKFIPSGKILFPPIREQMMRKAYGDWRIVIYESLVRASVIVYMRESSLSTDEQIANDEREGFVWVKNLADLLEGYKNQRDKYHTLDDFMHEVVKFYDKMANENV